jgi:hypothetical protein
MNIDKINYILSLFANNEYFVHLLNPTIVVEQVYTYNIINGDPLNELVALRWNEDNLEFGIQFTEAGFDSARLNNGNLIIEDSEGNDVEIQFLKKVQVPVTSFPNPSAAPQQ